uniref:Probable purine permease n=1 Tax=Ananas comosus var. bracteatus TaxID=296719 RepID=A0A6V7P7Z4_ANACO|nr:unnamed protein product [Ananas comosus var. bracteatus]
MGESTGDRDRSSKTITPPPPPQSDGETEANTTEHPTIMRRSLLALNFAIMVVGTAGSPLVLRLYFLRGGRRKWLSSWLQTGGWPLLLLPLLVSYALRRHRQKSMYLMTPRLFLSCAALGLLTGVDDLLYAYGVSYLPVSTSSLLVSTQLAFTALFAFLIVRQRLTASSANAVALLCVGAAMLGLNARADRPTGESRGRYYAGFAMTLAAAALYGLVLPLVELSQAAYARAAGRAVGYTLVMEMQLVMGFFATLFSTVGMIVNNDFPAIPREAQEFGLGPAGYYMVLVGCAILFQFFFLGTVGAIYYGSALLAGVVIALLIPVAEVLAVMFFDEPFNSTKGVALVLSLWGFASYFYGEFKANKAKEDPDHKCGHDQVS